MAGQLFYSMFKLRGSTASRRILDAMMFSFVIYLLVSLCVTWEPLAQVLSSNGVLSYLFTSNTKLILLSLAWIIILPLIVGFIYFNDYVHTILRKLKITTKTSRENTWNDVFASQDRYVIASLTDGRRVRGYPSMYSTDADEGFVYLYNPAWVNDDKENEDEPDYIESNCHGFLLNRENIELIEFTLDPGERLHKKP
jgi:hypothetical protein